MRHILIAASSTASTAAVATAATMAVATVPMRVAAARRARRRSSRSRDTRPQSTADQRPPRCTSAARPTPSATASASRARSAGAALQLTLRRRPRHARIRRPRDSRLLLAQPAPRRLRLKHIGFKHICTMRCPRVSDPGPSSHPSLRPMGLSRPVRRQSTDQGCGFLPWPQGRGRRIWGATYRKANRMGVDDLERQPRGAAPRRASAACARARGLDGAVVVDVALRSDSRGSRGALRR